MGGTQGAGYLAPVSGGWACYVGMASVYSSLSSLSHSAPRKRSELCFFLAWRLIRPPLLGLFLAKHWESFTMQCHGGGCHVRKHHSSASGRAEDLNIRAHLQHSYCLSLPMGTVGLSNT